MLPSTYLPQDNAKITLIEALYNQLVFALKYEGLTYWYFQNCRFFDATQQAEFLFDCIEYTIKQIIPNEINYLANYDTFKNYLEAEFEMPDKLIAVLARFLEQNQGVLSKRAREEEFSMLSEKEIKEIEIRYASIFI